MENELAPENLIVNAFGGSVDLLYRHSNFEASVASATEMEKGEWWINRVNVHRAYRGNGYGSKLVQLLVKTIKDCGGKEVTAAPGGYGEDPKKQYNFYYKNGFVDDNARQLLVIRLTPVVEDQDAV